MTEEELAALQADIVAVETAIKNFASGDRVSEVRFADRTIKYSEISLPELQAELARLKSQLPASSGRVRTIRYRGL